MVEVKFCGMTRPADARAAAAVGARYVGVVFAESPRRVGGRLAREILDAAGSGVGRVGVFGRDRIDDMIRLADEARLDVLQLHDGATPDLIERVRARFGGRIWGVVRLREDGVTPEVGELLGHADAVVLERWVPHALGGSGARLDWVALAETLAPLRGGADVVLAGGLTPATVGAAIAAIGPDIVDVSSGIENAPGIKDLGLMERFMEATRSVGERHAR